MGLAISVFSELKKNGSLDIKSDGKGLDVLGEDVVCDPMMTLMGALLGGLSE